MLVAVPRDIFQLPVVKTAGDDKNQNSSTNTEDDDSNNNPTNIKQMQQVEVGI